MTPEQISFPEETVAPIPMPECEPPNEDVQSDEDADDAIGR